MYDPLNIGLAIANLHNRVTKHDLTIEVGHDFALFRQMCAETEKQTVSEQFSPAKFDLLSNNSFWITVKTLSGQLVCTQALRLDDIGSHTLADLWAGQQPRVYGGKIGHLHAPTVFQISGRVVYHGEMWVEAEFRKLRFGGIMTMLGQLLAVTQWRPDYVYIFMCRELAERGFAYQVGYSHQQVAGTHWLEAPDGIDPSDLILWNSAADIDFLARQIVLGNV